MSLILKEFRFFEKCICGKRLKGSHQAYCSTKCAVDHVNQACDKMGSQMKCRSMDQGGCVKGAKSSSRTSATLRTTKKKAVPLSKYRKDLEKKLEKTQRLIVLLRDGGCVLRGVYQHDCSKILQADHLISRANKSVFYDLKNLNCVCSTINATKGRHWNGWETIQRHLERITNERYGAGTVDSIERRARKPWDRSYDTLEQILHCYEGVLPSSTLPHNYYPEV